MTYVKTHWINNEEPSIDADNLNHMEQGIEDAQYPDGGSAGQLLAKTANGTEWVDAPNSAVWGLIQGQLNEQEDLYAELESKIVAPTGGTTGQYLRKTAGGTEWADAGSIDTVNNISPDANKNVQTVVELTQAQYNALANPDPNITYLITDGINNPANNTINGSGVSYDNTDSGLTATTVQGAVDELSNGLTSVSETMTESGSYSSIVNTNYGAYVYKSGNMVICRVAIALKARTGEAGWLEVFTLPYPSKNNISVNTITEKGNVEQVRVDGNKFYVNIFNTVPSNDLLSAIIPYFIN